jgi:nicotinate-nucleotide pyrophosphorylase (carboxylating)
MNKTIIKLALAEDLDPSGDISGQMLENQKAKAQIIAKEPGIMACRNLVSEILQTYCEIYCPEENFEIVFHKAEGAEFQAKEILVEIYADIKILLATERTILNFLQRLTAISTQARKLTSMIQKTNCKLLDTRKSSPGLRLLSKEALRIGGGTNHRMNLSDMVMLKENHIAGIKHTEIQKLIQNLKNKFPQVKIEVEINKDNLPLLKTFVENAVDIVMLDNFDYQELPVLVSQIRSLSALVKIEASGGINENNLLDYAQTGVDYISMGSVFTQAGILDLSMIIEIL